MAMITALICFNSIFSLWWFLKYFSLTLTFLEWEYFSMGMFKITKGDPVMASVCVSTELLIF